MKLIISQIELEKEFKRLACKYKQFYWATAWASSRSKLFNALISRQDRIERIVVGIHFYQTHPDFIEAFINHSKVRFIKQPEGTFHPKLYLFYNSSDDWEILIGSANFTEQAFTKNTEATTLISSNDQGVSKIIGVALKLIDDSWKEATQFTRSELEHYRTAWKNHISKINSLSGLYGGKKKAKPIHEVSVITMTWKEFMEKVYNEKLHALGKRLRVVEIAKELFVNNDCFSAMDLEERKFIAGIPNRLDVEGAENWGYFGSMKGAGIFKNKIIQNNQDISRALDQIPLSGQITRAHYSNFIKYFIKVFSGNYMATATRLLAMKRPDTFVCLDNRNKANLCRDFGIVQSGMSYDRYWEDIIERIYDSDWWLSPNPTSEQEKRVSESRAAFLDSLYYEE